MREIERCGWRPGLKSLPAKRNEDCRGILARVDRYVWNSKKREIQDDFDSRFPLPWALGGETAGGEFQRPHRATLGGESSGPGEMRWAMKPNNLRGPAGDSREDRVASAFDVPAISAPLTVSLGIPYLPLAMSSKSPLVW